MFAQLGKTADDGAVLGEVHVQADFYYDRGYPGLEEIRIYERDGGVAIEALARQSEVEDSDLVARVCPLLCNAVRLVAHRVIRNRGTLCGSLAHADPASEVPAVLLALGGHVVARSTRASR